MTYASTTRTWYNHETQPVREYLYPRPISLERHRSTPEALPTGYRRTHDRRHPIGSVESIGFTGERGREVYRMRTQSHLYDDYDVETGLDLERMAAQRDGRLLADCHACKVTHHVTPDQQACPICGGEL